VVVGGDRGNLGVRHSDLRIKRGKFQMLLVFLRAVMAARKRQDQGIVALEFAEFARCARVIGQLIVRKNVSGYEVMAHDWILSQMQLGYGCARSNARVAYKTFSV